MDSIQMEIIIPKFKLMDEYDWSKQLTAKQLGRMSYIRMVCNARRKVWVTSLRRRAR